MSLMHLHCQKSLDEDSDPPPSGASATRSGYLQLVETVDAGRVRQQQSCPVVLSFELFTSLKTSSAAAFEVDSSGVTGGETTTTSIYAQPMRRHHHGAR